MSLSNQLIKGVLKTIVLKVISKYDRIHGYEIIKIVKQKTIERIQITEGALYPILHSLESGKYLESNVEYFGKRVRKYYRINPNGKALLNQKINETVTFINALELILAVNTIDIIDIRNELHRNKKSKTSVFK